MYYSDLSPHAEYSITGALAVGWLDKRHPFPQGATSEEFKERLFEFCCVRLLETRGFHICDFCTPPPNYNYRVEHNGKELWMGSAEIRVIYGNKVYAAPNLIYHYVVEHNYRPPDEFIEAVVNGVAPDSPEYAEFIARHWDQ